MCIPKHQVDKSASIKFKHICLHFLGLINCLMYIINVSNEFDNNRLMHSLPQFTREEERLGIMFTHT